MEQILNYPQLLRNNYDGRGGTKILAFYATRLFITVFTRAHHWSLRWARWIQTVPSHPVSLRSVFRLLSLFWRNESRLTTSHCCLCVPPNSFVFYAVVSYQRKVSDQFFREIPVILLPYYVGVLISLWLFLFSYLQHNQKNFSWMG
jgi:hypothetical protein